MLEVDDEGNTARPPREEAGGLSSTRAQHHEVGLEAHSGRRLRVRGCRSYPPNAALSIDARRPAEQAEAAHRRARPVASFTTSRVEHAAGLIEE
jgi:hypothetical protein